MLYSHIDISSFNPKYIITKSQNSKTCYASRAFDRQLLICLPNPIFRKLLCKQCICNTNANSQAGELHPLLRIFLSGHIPNPHTFANFCKWLRTQILCALIKITHSNY